MKKQSIFSLVLLRALIIAMLCLPMNAGSIYAIVASPPLAAANIKVNNNFGMSDTVEVTSGLGSGDIVKVYGTASSTTALGTGTATGSSISVTLTTALSSGLGTAYITVKKSGSQYGESIRVAKSYTSETSITPVLANVVAVNNKLNTNDTITVQGLQVNDRVKVYAVSTATTPIVTSNAVPNGQSSITIAQQNMLATSIAGTVYVSVLSFNKRESLKLAVPFKSDVSAAPVVSNMTATNAKATANDIVTASGLSNGDIIKVYVDSKTTTPAGTSSAVSSPATSVTITGATILNNTNGGTVYVTLTSTDKVESPRVALSYGSDISTIPSGVTYTATNNRAGVSDQLLVGGLAVNDVVNIYETSSSVVSLGTGTVTSGTSVTFSAAAMFANSAGGTVYMTVTSQYKNESVNRTAVSYPTDVSVAPKTVNIVQNPTGTNDIITVSGLAPGDVAKVYQLASDSSALATSSAVANGSTTATLSTNLLSRGGTAYVTVVRLNKSESTRVAKTYPSEPVSVPTLTTNISGTNQKQNVADTVTVTNLAVGDLFVIYDAVTDGVELGRSQAISNGTVANLSANNILPLTTGGQVFIAIKNPNKLESTRVPFAYGNDKSGVPDGNGFELFNARTSVADTIDVSGLSVGDTIRIYDTAADGTLLAEETVTSGTTLNFSGVDLLPTTINGQVYATLETASKSESDRIAVFYDSDQSPELDLNQVVVGQNKKGVADTIDVEGLPEGAVVEVYDGSDEQANLLATSAAVASGQSAVQISQIDLLDAEGGSFFIAVTNDDMEESERVEISYDPEQIAAILDPTQIVTVNNQSGATDSVTVNGMASGDTIYLYHNDDDVNYFDHQNHTAGTSITISGADLLTATSDSGYIYISITNENKSESPKLAVKYLSDRTPALFASQVVITQNATGSADTIVVSGLQANDVVKWYDEAINGTQILSPTPTYSSGTATFSAVDMLTDTGGTVHLTVTSQNKTESVVLSKAYASEPRTTLTIGTLNKSSQNNRTGVADTFSVTSGLTGGDQVLVYSSMSATTPVATGTVSNGGNTLTISHVDLFGQQSGSIYVSIKQYQKLEATTRVAYTFAAVAATTSIDANNVLVKNFTNVSNDEISIFGLSPGDEINIYSDQATTSQMCIASPNTCTWTVGNNANSVVITGLAGLSDNSGGVFYVTVRNTKLNVSSPTTIYYSNARSVQPLVSNVTVTNNEISINDELVVTNLASGDVVSVYRTASLSDTALLNGATETAALNNGVYEVTFDDTEFLEDAGGEVYVTITGTNKLESNRTKVTYNAIGQTATPTTITITNLPAAEAADEIIISGYSAPNSETFVVKVYDGTSNSLLSTSGSLSLDGNGDIVYDGSNIITATNAGSVKITVTSSRLLESLKSSAISFTKDYTDPVPSATNVQVLNDDGGTDIVRIKWASLQVNDLVYIYDAGTSTDHTSGGATVSTAGVLKVTGLTLNAAGGSLDITVKRGDLAESTILTVTYLAE